MTLMKPENKEYKNAMKTFSTEIIVASTNKDVKELLKISRHMNRFFVEHKEKYGLNREQRKEYKKIRGIAKTVGQFVKVKKV